MRSKRRSFSARRMIESLEERRLLASYVPIAGINDVVFDPLRNVVYATTSSGSIQRYDVQSGQLLAPWNIGGNLLGADITPDSTYLYVADGTNPQIRKVNLEDGTSVPLTYSPQSLESNAYDVAIVGTRAIFTTQFAGSGWVPLRNIDLPTDVTTTRTDLGSVRQNSVLSRAADRSALFLTESNTSSGPIHYYDTSQNLFTRHGSTQTSLSNTLHDVSRDGQLVALQFGGISLFDNTLAGIGNLAGLTGGFRFDPGRDFLYGINPTTDELIGFDTVDKVQRFNIPLGRNFSGASQFASGMMAVGGTRAFISDDVGILVLDLPQQTGEGARAVLSGHYSFSRKGVPGTVRVQVLDPAGFPAVNYRGTVHFNSTDASAVLPGPYTFDADDLGYVELPVTLNATGIQTIIMGDPANTSVQASLAGRQVHNGNISLVPVTDRREHVFDPDRNRLYISTSRGAVERYDLATETLLEPLPVGTNLYGIDISADNRWLMIQEGASTGTGGQYIKVDLQTLDSSGLGSEYITRILYTNSSLERGGWDIARTIRGTFAADGQFAGSGWVPVRDVNPLTNTAPTMPAFGSVRQNTGIGRSPDGRYLIYTENNISSGPVTVFDTLTNQIVSSIGTGVFLSGESSPVNRDGTLFGVRLSGMRIYDRALAVVTTLTSIDGGGAFDPVSDVFYGVNSAADRVDVYRTSDWTIVNNVAIGENVSSSGAMNSGVMTVALDGGQLFLSTPAGIRVLTLGTRALPGNHSVVEGDLLNLTGSAVAAPGRTIVTYEWDFDYDGAMFTADAVGQTVAMPTAGLDGPSARTIALRVLDSGEVSDIATSEVSIINAAPILSATAPATIGVGQSLTITLGATDAGPDSISQWAIHWDEGPVQFVPGGTGSVSRVLNNEGTHTITIQATDEDGQYWAAPVEVLVSTPPTVQSVEYQCDAVVPTLEVVFSEDVSPSIDRGDFEIIHLATGLGVPLSKMQVQYELPTNTARITFPGFASGMIPDGNYHVHVAAAGIRDGIANALDGNSDGVAGDDAMGSVFILAADANCDRRVDLQDLMILANNWQGTGKTFNQGDFNYDGVVNATDLGILSTRWQQTLAEPLPSQPIPTSAAAKRAPVRTPTRISTQILA